MTAPFEGSEHLGVNILGHAAGVLLFGLFLYLALRQRSSIGPRSNVLSLLAACLALIWNLASLLVLALGSEASAAGRITAAMGFSVLSILPAVLLQLYLRDRFPVISRCGYVLSFAAVAAHVLELVHEASIYHRIGLGLITAGFGLLTVIAVIRVVLSHREDSRPESSRILAAMSLFLFAISFVHFGEGGAYQAWSAELAVHHAGIPLALFVLFQDYRFVLLDAFIRFLANGLLAGLFAVAIVSGLSGLDLPLRFLTAGLLLAGFAVARDAVQRLLTRIVFRQLDPEKTAAELRLLRAQGLEESAYLGEAARRIAAFIKAATFESQTGGFRSDQPIMPALASDLLESRTLQRRGIRVVVPVRLSQGDVHYLLLGERQGGRPYLSEDLGVLARLAACVAEQVTEIRASEVRRLVSQAELRALQSQIHPHFLFNALNALYGVIPREAAAARRMLLDLSEILRYFLKSERTFVPLDEEIRIVKAYLAIEQLRLGHKLKTEIEVDDAAAREVIPVLSIQPLVENAVKHGASARPQGGRVRVEVKLRSEGLRVLVQDTGPGFGSGIASTDSNHAGVGLENVAQRLRLCYGPGAELLIESNHEGSSVSFVVPSHSAVALRA